MVNGLSERAVGENGLIAGLFHERRWRRHHPGDPLGQNRVTPRETTDRSQALRFGVIPTSHEIWTIVETPLAHARSYQKSKTQMMLVYYALMLRRRGRQRACSRSWVVGPGNLPAGGRLLVGDSGRGSGRGKSGKNEIARGQARPENGWASDLGRAVELRRNADTVGGAIAAITWRPSGRRGSGGSRKRLPSSRGPEGT